MIVLYRRPDDPWADEVQEALDEMVIAYETESVPDADALPADVPDTPALRDDGEVITGGAALRIHLEELRALMNDWDRFQSDACYVEDDGSIC
jgi:glutathione S-transferase